MTRGFGLLENFLSKQRTKRANKLILRYNKKGRILDIGCGTNPWFLMSCDFEEKFGIDQQIRNITYSNRNLTLLNQNICSNPRLPFDKERFDVITLLAVVEHLYLHQIQNLLIQCYNLLKLGGILIITTPARWSNILLKFMAKLHLVSADEIMDHKGEFSIRQLFQLVYNSNFQKKKIRYGYFELFLNLWICAQK